MAAPIPAALDLHQPFADVAAEQRVELLGNLADGHLLRLELPPRAGERQPVDKQQVFEPEHPLQIGAAIHARAASRFRDAEVRELCLPRPQHVRLDLRDLAHLRLPKQRAVGDLHCGRGHQERKRQYTREFG